MYLNTHSKPGISSFIIIITIILIIIIFSGVLAVAVAGLVVASMSGPVILNKKSMEDIWQWIEWIGNTLIFLLAGLITGHKVLKSIYGRDWLILFCLFITVSICRFVTVGFLYPLLKRLGYGMTPKEAVFIRYNTIILSLISLLSLLSLLLLPLLLSSYT